MCLTLSAPAAIPVTDLRFADRLFSFCPRHSFPILYVLEQATGSTAGAIVLTVALSSLTAGVASVATQATAGRVIWSFALDGGIPFSRWFTKISSTNHVPVRALIVVCVIEMLLVLIYIGNAPLFNSILVLAISLLNLS